MNSFQSLYRRLPRDFRVRVRSLVPDDALRWYAHKNTDVYLISYPKCGRTWLRLMIGKAIVQHYNLPETEAALLLQERTKLHQDVPRISVVHDDRPMLKSPDELEESKSRFKDKKVIFLVRDPRDVIVSSYFEMKKRGGLFGDNPYEPRQATFEDSLPEFINRRRGGFDTILRFYNIWADNRHVTQGFLLVRYEDIKSDPYKELRRILQFLDLGEISDRVINEAVEYASFENMRKLEEQGRFSAGMLKPANREDENSYKTRKGKIGGYQEYLSEDEIARLNRKMNETLSGFYGYTEAPVEGDYHG